MPIKIRKLSERILDFNEIEIPLSKQEAISESALCLQCGTPFCHAACPTNDLIPDWVDDVLNDRVYEAYQKIELTNSFPEFTGRICDAPCEYGCTLQLHDSKVSIRDLEKYVADTAWALGWVKPQIAKHKIEKRNCYCGVWAIRIGLCATIVQIRV